MALYTVVNHSTSQRICKSVYPLVIKAAFAPERFKVTPFYRNFVQITNLKRQKDACNLLQGSSCSFLSLRRFSGDKTLRCEHVPL